jgi:hypothetical protein
MFHFVATATQTESKRDFNKLPSISQSIYGLGYGLDNEGTMVRFLAGGRDLSLLHNIQMSYRAHP